MPEPLADQITAVTAPKFAIGEFSGGLLCSVVGIAIVQQVVTFLVVDGQGISLEATGGQAQSMAAVAVLGAGLDLRAVPDVIDHAGTQACLRVDGGEAEQLMQHAPGGDGLETRPIKGAAGLEVGGPVVHRMDVIDV